MLKHDLSIYINTIHSLRTAADLAFIEEVVVTWKVVLTS